jgi:hypothetical protein
MLSPAGSLPEVPCVRCHERIAGLAWGDRCPRCVALRRTRARSIARRLSLLAALVTAILLGWTTTPGPNQRIWIGIGTMASFFFIRIIALRVAMELLPD